ncbi:MAG: hypothetical protein AAGI23_00345 [Bacteroidota bacterium]
MKTLACTFFIPFVLFSGLFIISVTFKEMRWIIEDRGIDVPGFWVSTTSVLTAAGCST